MRRTAAVTGAAGYVGINLVSRLRELGWSLRTTDACPLYGVPLEGIEHVIADVRDLDAMRAVFDGVEIVFHLAAHITLLAEDPEAWDVNARGPGVVGAAALEAGVRRLVHCSSVHAFDLAQARPRLTELSPRSVSPSRPLYDRSKWAGEVALRDVVDKGLDATIVNPTGIIGPVDLGMSRMNAVIDAAARGHLPVVVHGGFDWVDVRDVAEGMVAAVDRGRTGENYLLGGNRASALHIGRLAAALNGHVGPVIAVPGHVARWTAPTGEHIGRLFDSDVFTPASIGTLLDDPIVDHGKARAELGYRPRPLEDTVRDTVRWFEGDPHL